jgi:hypothetical protein
MVGNLHKTERGWFVRYKMESDLVATDGGLIPLYPNDIDDYLFDLEHGKEVEFNIISGYNYEEGGVPPSYAKIKLSKEDPLEFLTRQAQELNLGYDTNDGWDNFIFESERILHEELPTRYKNWLKIKFQPPIRK